MTAGMSPLRHLVVLGHPAHDSFNHALAQAYCGAVRENGQEAKLNDLYARAFDPLLRADERPGPEYRMSESVMAELEMLRRADIVVLVYPVWFGTPPAIIKGYIERVMGADFSSDAMKALEPSPLLDGKPLLTLSTSASTRPWLEERGQWLATRQAFDNYLVGVFGMERSEHVHFDAVVEGMKPIVAEEKLEMARATARRMCAHLLQKRNARRAGRA